MAEKKGTEGKSTNPTPDQLAAEQIAGLTGKEIAEEKPVAAAVATQRPVEAPVVPQMDIAALLKQCKDLGLTVSIGTGKQVILEDDDDYSDIPEPEADKNEPKVLIRIDEQDNTDKNADVFVSCNGMPYLIKRGFDVEVPVSIYQVLEDAVITHETEDEKTGEVTTREIKRFAVRKLGDVK